MEETLNYEEIKTIIQEHKELFNNFGVSTEDDFVTMLNIFWGIFSECVVARMTDTVGVEANSVEDFELATSTKLYDVANDNLEQHKIDVRNYDNDNYLYDSIIHFFLYWVKQLELDKIYTLKEEAPLREVDDEEEIV